MSLTLGPCRFHSFSGGLEVLAEGRTDPDALKMLDARLPQPNSLRRASEDTKAAVLAATELLRGAGVGVSERVGLYVGQQQIALDYCATFVESSYRDGPRMASPMMFSESVANNIATHLSLTLGLKGAAQTLIGTRAAGIQAVMAAGEDVESGHIDVGLVVVVGVASSLTRDAYVAVNRPFQRRRPPEVSFLRGTAALLVRRDDPGQPKLLFAGTRCGGRSAAAMKRSVAGLLAEAGRAAGGGCRVLDSTLGLARERNREALAGAGADGTGMPALGESYALDPFVRLLLDSRRHPGPEGRAVVCLGEEGTASLLALDGPLRLVDLRD